jgi:para-nitrobenzyl esterase
MAPGPAQAAAVGLAALALAACAAPAQPPAEASQPLPPAVAPRTAVLTCEGGRTLRVVFGDRELRFEADGREVRLSQLPSGSGIHYAGDGHDLRGKGVEMTWTDPAGVARTCRDEALAAAAGAGAGTAALSGIAWTLVEYRPPQAATPIVPPHRERYTVTFDADGRLALRLDCNRGMGRWTATPSAPNAGALSVAGGAMTRAMCGPGAIDSQISRDLGRVRTYAVEGGRLSLTLDDGGVYLWSPGPG